MTFDDYADEEWVEDDGPDEDDLLACPSCGESVHEDAQQCPYCGDWIIPVYPGEGRKKAIWLVAVAFVILAFLIFAIR